MSNQSISAIYEQPVVMPIPFASDSGATANDIPVTPPNDGSITPNLTEGFPFEYSSPKSAGGTYVTRGQMNGIGRLMTANETRRRLGGINKYNSSFATIAGGYAKDAVLDWWDEKDQIVCKVVSLVDGNTYDFTERGSDGYSVGPDGVHWAICTSNGMSLPDYSNGVEILAKTSVSLPTEMNYVTSDLEMPFDGFVSVGVSGEYKIPCSLFTAVDSSQIKFKFVNGVATTGLTLFNFAFEGVKVKFYGVIPGDVYDLCRHSLYLALSSDGTFDVDMNNIIDGNTTNTLLHVSSSGTEGGGGSLLIPVKKGKKFRLLGNQTYSNARSSHFAPEGTLAAQNVDTVMASNALNSVGSVAMSVRIVAYPAIGLSSGE